VAELTKKDRESLEYLEEILCQLDSAYNSAQDEIKELKAHIEILKDLCKINSIEIPKFEEFELL
jgi:hypothetical protein